MQRKSYLPRASLPADAVTKPSNPKEAFGEVKMSMGLVPDTAIIDEELAFLEGALKYGQYNWRIAGVKASTYRRAIARHLSKWWNGQDRDPATLVKELASVRACCGIVLDAIAAGKFTDDRPPRANIERALADAAVTAAHLKQLFAGHNPPQYTQLEHGEVAVMDAVEAQEVRRAALDLGPAAYIGTGRREGDRVPAGTPRGLRNKNPANVRKRKR